MFQEVISITHYMCYVCNIFILHWSESKFYKTNKVYLDYIYAQIWQQNRNFSISSFFYVIIIFTIPVTLLVSFMVYSGDKGSLV